MNTTLTLYQLNSSSWMYQLSSYYINFYAYDIPQKLQPNLIALARDPIERQWDRMKKLANLRCHIFSTHILISKIDLLFIIPLLLFALIGFNHLLMQVANELQFHLVK